MATALQLEIDTPQATSIVAQVDANPVMVLTDREKFNRFYEEIKRETDALDADVTTEKGRKAIASMAYKVARTKTAIDEAGKKLNEEARARINAVDESRREIRQQLDTLKDEVRAPLTAWEEAEEERVADCNAIIASLRNVVVLPFGASAADARERLAEIQALKLDEARLQGFYAQALLLHEQAVATLQFQAEQLAREEEGRAELQRLQAAEAERLAREAEEQAERDRIEAERIAAEQAEQRRREAEEAEAARLRAAEERAAQAAREEEARKAREAEEARQREHEAALAEERRQREEAEATARKEREARERADAERAERERVAAAEAARIAEETRLREANRAHRTKVQRAAKEAIMTCGADEETARKVVLAIIAGEIPRVRLEF